MQEIILDNVKPGMRLACRVRSADGLIVAEENEELTEASIKRLHMVSGVKSVLVLGRHVHGVPKGYNTAQRLKNVGHLFRNHKENIFMSTLCAFLKKHFEKRL